MNKYNQNILCDVFRCRFNNNDLKYCELDKIKISCNCDNEKCNSKDKTICDSYIERK